MPIPLYLAMTAAEFSHAKAKRCAWMSCLFSPYGTGLTNLPHSLPEDSLLILSDRTPICGHDPKRIASQLRELAEQIHPCGILLDFQRRDHPETGKLVKELVTALSCPVCVSDVYARESDYPVFLPPPALNIPLSQHLATWKGREIWLEAALDQGCFCVTAAGCQVIDVIPEGDFPHCDEVLHCHYRIEAEPDQVRFTLQRTREDLDALLTEAEALGVTKAVGLWQELG